MQVSSNDQRRARLVTRHHLRGDADGLVVAARSVVVLHATDPATVYLSLLARCHGASLDDVQRVLYEERRLVRMMGMRRTLFVVPEDLVPVVHHGAALDIAAWLRRRLVTELGRLPTEPELPDDVAGWLESVEAETEAALLRSGSATGAQLSSAVPRLRTKLLPTTTKAYDVRRTVTTQVLVLMGTEGRIVRARPSGSWTSRRHTWEPGAAWWPGGITPLDPEVARARLAEAYLRSFGPAGESDVAWWTGWSLGTTRKALASLETVDHDGLLVLADDADPVGVPEPTAALLPALDPTPMGWKERSWFLPEDPAPLYDRNGNIGPTVWWGGEVVGAWAVRRDGAVVTRLLADRGQEAIGAVRDAAERLQARLEGAVVTPSFRTPLSADLADGEGEST